MVALRQADEDEIEGEADPLAVFEDAGSRGDDDSDGEEPVEASETGAEDGHPDEGPAGEAPEGADAQRQESAASTVVAAAGGAAGVVEVDGPAASGDPAPPGSDAQRAAPPTVSVSTSGEEAPLGTDDAGPPGRRAVRPHYVSLGRTAARHVRLIVAFALVGLIGGVGFGVLKTPGYHAQARLVVGTNTSLANVAAAAGLPAAEDAFAAEYARLLTDGSVQRAIAARLHLKQVPGTVTASPVPQSPVIQVDATASSTAGAVALAQAGAESLLKEIYRLNNATTATVQGLVSLYQQAEQAIATDQATERDLQNQLNSLPSTDTSAISTLQNRLSAAQAEIAAQQLRANALSGQFENAYSPLQQEEDTVKISSDAAPSGSNRRSDLEIGVLAGLIGGAVVGLAVAAVFDLRQSPDPAETRA